MTATETAHSQPESESAQSGEIFLPETEWKRLRMLHEKRVGRWLDPHQARTARGEKHPVYDFLFDYYSFRPGHLRRWQPGLGVVLQGPDAAAFLKIRGYERRPRGIALSTALKNRRGLDGIRWIAALLEACEQRSPQFACFGLHEWAMVYRAEHIRHATWPLRFSQERIAGIVESLPIRCSHFDAFRFFTEASRPLNRLQPTRENRLELEQRGCLHANMDLYKWAYKLSPWTPSELLADTFELARDIREIDMRASPYDLSDLGFAPIPVETPDGRAYYESRQREFASRAQPLRLRLLGLCRRLLGGSGPSSGAGTSALSTVVAENAKTGADR